MELEGSLPREVEDLIAMARSNVARVIGVEPDLTPETLPLVDQYLREVPRDASGEVLALVVSSVGAYFGEVVRQRLGGRWTLCGSHPATWRIELSSCFLYFLPFGMVGEVMQGVESDAYDGSFSILDELRDGLAEVLNARPPVPEEEYFSLCGRIDTLELVADWLLGLALTSARIMRAYSAEDYRRIIERGVV
jgi:hypothetical protein